MNTTLVSRRRFVATTIAGGFALGWSWPQLAGGAATGAAPAPMPRPPQPDGAALAAGGIALTDWLRITRDDVVTVVVSQAEMGQGISTTLPALLCDELGADWPRVRIELAPTAPAYRHPKYQWQFTGNSESVQSFAPVMRQVGAAARLMLIRAAAAQWQVPEAQCTTRDGAVLHRDTQRRLRFGDLAEAAARLPVPDKPPLRPDTELRLHGRSVPRIDVPEKVDGSAQFGIDFVPPDLDGLVFAAVRSAPAYGAKVLRVDRAAIQAQPGVVDVIELPGAVAVIAHRYWQARAALNAAQIDFDAGPQAAMSSESLRAQYHDRLERGPFVVAKDQQPDAARPSSQARLEAVYELPFQAHATLEPMNALAHVRADRVDVWAPTQGQELAKLALAGMLQRSPETVHIHRTPYLGGGFGRRLLPDFVIEAALLSKAAGRPVKLIWSREEDLRRDSYRPATLHRLSAEIGADGLPMAIAQRLVSPTILKPVFPTFDFSNGLDPSALEGSLATRYRIPGWRTEFHLLEIAVPTSVYRTTGYGPTLFGIESFIDELALRSRSDPYRYRRRLLAHDARALRVLDEAARLAAWERPLAARRGEKRGRGIAFAEVFETLLAQVVEVTLRGNDVKVDRVVSVVDPGRVHDPRIADAGIEGGVIWGLSSVCKDEIGFSGGAVMQTNFHAYDFLRMHETPHVVTRFLETPDVPLGAVGEVGPVTVVPALANAIAAAGGPRLRTMPLKRSGLQLV